MGPQFLCFTRIFKQRERLKGNNDIGILLRESDLFNLFHNI